MLKKYRGFSDISDWILYHHERVDGNGYMKKRGDEIPFASRIIAVLDTYSSIMMASSFKPSRTHEEAVSVLRMAAGTQLDERLVEVFCRIPSGLCADAAGEVNSIMSQT